MMGFGMGGFGSLLILALLGIGIYYFVKERDGRSRDEHASGGRGSDSALEVLRQRYARGEIDKAEFDERRRELDRPE